MKKNKFILLLLIVLSISSCVSTDPGVEFFINKKNIQYFFPSREWDSLNKEIKFDADFLYRNYPTAEDNGIPKVIMNFTLYSDSTFFRTVPTSIVISSANKKIEINDDQVNIIFIDKGKTRYTAVIESEVFDEIIRYSSDTLYLDIIINSIHYNLQSNKTFLPHINYYKEVILGEPIE
ncbi:MAG: hypothetical protein JXR64_04965 [Spirochaetales bacterium]|nr:hypothetical protein [Spirochaetales bacterium]